MTSSNGINDDFGLCLSSYPVCREESQAEAFSVGENLEEAAHYYAEVEKSIDEANSAVVLVSVSDMKELQDAHPSYFLNAGEFIDSLQDFNNMCLSKHYL